jgi:peptide chain release factor 1
MSGKQKELLFSVTKKDFEVTWFSGTGAGGQYRNKHQNCCRIIHKESGAIGTGQSQRDRIANQKEAFMNCVKSSEFVVWLNKKIFEMDYGDSIDDLVDKAMSDNNIKIEVFENGEWREEKNE